MFGSDLEVLEHAGQKVINILNGVRGISNPGLFHIVGQPNLEIQIDRHECARYGINVSDVEAVVQVAVGGRAFTRMVEGEKLFDIVLRLPKDRATIRKSSAVFRSTLPVRTANPAHAFHCDNSSTSTHTSLALHTYIERITADTFQ